MNALRSNKLGCASRMLGGLALTFGVVALPASAQATDPRFYLNVPKNLNSLVVLYEHSSGNVSADESVPVLEGAKVSLRGNTFAARYTRSFGFLGRLAKAEVFVPIEHIGGTVTSPSLNFRGSRTGLIDPVFRIGANLLGTPALDLKGFSKFHQETIVGASFTFTAPLGQYDSSKLVNLGSNRWKFKPELGVSRAFGRWIAELYGSATFATDNREYRGSSNLSQLPTLELEGHVVREFPRYRLAITLDSFYFNGGESSVNGVSQNDYQHDLKFGGTVVYRLNRRSAIGAGINQPAVITKGPNVSAFSFFYSYSWGPE
jgi:hypothetical protein